MRMSDKGYQKLRSSSSDNEGRGTKEAQILSPVNLVDPTTNRESLVKTQDAIPGVGTGEIVLFSPTDISGAGKPDAENDLVEVDLTHEDVEKKKTIWTRLKGILSILTSSMLISYSNQLVFLIFEQREGKAAFSPSLFFTWASMFYSIINYIPLQYHMYKNLDEIVQPFKDDKRFWWLLVIRGLCGSMVPFSVAHAMAKFKMPAPVFVITAMAPIVVYFNAYFALGEPIGVIPIINAFVAIAGVFVMNLEQLLTHNDEAEILEGTGIAFSVMLLLSWVAVVVRIIRKVNPFVINLSFGVFGFIVQGVIVLIENNGYWIHNDPQAWGMCFAVASLTAASNFLFNIAMRYESAGVVSLLKTTDVLFSFFFEFILFGIQPNKYVVIGGAIIVLGVMCVTFRKIVGESSENSKLRKNFWFLLY